MKRIKLFTNIIPVKGNSRSLLYDLGENKVWFIPNQLYDLIRIDNTLESDIKKPMYKEYYSFLKENKLVFEDSDEVLSMFPKLEFSYESNSKIDCLIIDLDEEFEVNDITKIVSSIEKQFFPYHLFFTCLDLDLNKCIHKLLKLLNSNDLENFASIGLKINSQKKPLQSIANLSRKCKKLNNIFIEDDFVEKVTQIRELDNIIAYKVPKKQHKYYNSLSSDIFSVNLDFFSESLNYNTFFNNKLYIDKTGEIKNTPISKETFGNIRNKKILNNLENIISSDTFHQYWGVHKELIDVCKDCEFRHMCVDDRLPIKRKDNTWFHKKQCNYNPYISKWKGEEGYKGLEECGVFLNEDGYKRDDEKIKLINEQLWN